MTVHPDRHGVLALSEEQVLAVMQMASSPLAKMLLAIAYYSMTADSRIAEAVWE